ncbi:MAG: proliferating cell nuclear antigen (pcna) [Candidatus Diapherotrites archaeon CG08_land_8_20_14_0_20_34_12]|nr:MAG: proliferating cell nuclear antigen (pcna) [Candidatus Diapherotrites archaeon CG08_land_8_20_14_0_20_34_12]
MILSLENAQSFKRCIDSISVLIDEAEFLISENGLELRATDPSQISMIDFKINKTAFKQFDVKDDIKLGIDIGYLSQILGRAKKDDFLSLELNATKSSLNVTFTAGNAKRTFSVPLIDISQAQLPSLNIDFDSTISMKADVIKEALKDAALISSYVVIMSKPDKFVAEANSSKGHLVNEIPAKDPAIKEFKVKKECRSMFPLEYLQNMLKAAESNDAVSVSMKNNAPIQISYKIDKAEITYYLAPRIETE